jgi:hypothetical protein
MRRYIALAAVFALPVVSAGAAEISWSVANGFQQFKNDADFQTLKEAWKPQMSAEAFLVTQNAASLRRLLPIKNTWWDEENGLYNNDGLFNPSHNVLLTYLGTVQGQTCQWSIDGNLIGSAVPCDAKVKASEIKENTPFTISVSVDGASAQELINQRITTKLILAVGDSFASGEGNPDHAAITNTVPEKGSGKENKTGLKTLDWFLKENMGNQRFTASADWWDTACHRSFLSWQSLYAIRKAVADPHLVVRFASFSCSGAEAYDGFFRAQSNPPVEVGARRVHKGWTRDGGNITVALKVKEERRPEKTVLIEDKSTKTVLNKSQLNAAIALLCDGKTTPGFSKSFRPQREGLRSSPYYGEFKYDKCQGSLRQPDELLTSFGGNDFGFSGVVMWGLVPRTAVGKSESIEKLFRTWSLSTFRGLMKVQEPKPAGKMASDQTYPMYSDLAWTYINLFNVKGNGIKELIYPNPLPERLSEVCSGRMGQGNAALSAFSINEGNKRFITRGKFDNFVYRIEDEHAEEIVRDFIVPLQVAQRAAITKLGWTPIESQRGFESPTGARTMCAVASACDRRDGKCDWADLPGWRDPRHDLDPSWKPMQNITQWESYSPTRMRGLRMSNDSVLTQARFVDGKIQKDWINGSVHPVAQVHAGIADSIDNSPKVVTK